MDSKSIFVKGSNYSGDSDRFHPIRDRLKITLTLKEAAESAASVVIWTAERRHVVHTKMVPLLIPKKLLYLDASPSEELKALTLFLAKDPDPTCQMLIYQPHRAVVGFKCAILGIDELGLKIGFPDILYRVQRREHQRYQIRSGYEVRAKVKDPSNDNEIIEATVLDLSVGGLALRIDEEDVFSVGEKIKDLQFEVRGRKIIADCKVQNIKKLDGNLGYQIGFAFQELSFSDMEYLSFYIGENTALFSE